MQNPLKQNSLLGMVGAPVVWIVHFALCYIAVSLICDGGYTGDWLGGISLAGAIVGVLTVAAFALLVYIAVVNYRIWADPPLPEMTSDGMVRFIALCSVMLCGLSIVALLWVAFPAYVLPACAV
jgi:hypothetical protein